MLGHQLIETSYTSASKMKIDTPLYKWLLKVKPFLTTILQRPFECTSITENFSTLSISFSQFSTSLYK